MNRSPNEEPLIGTLMGARLLSEGDRGAETADLLRGVYDEFSEGFELPDLRAAQALLRSQ